MGIKKVDFKFGKYLVKNIPIQMDKRVGEPIFTVEVKNTVGRIVDYMDKNELTTFDYNNWEDK